MLLAIAVANAQNTGTMEQVAVLTRYEIKKDAGDVFRQVIGGYVNRAVNDKNNIMAEAYYEEENPSILWTIERWDNETAFRKIRESNEFKEVKILSAKELLQPVKIFYVNDLEPLSKDKWRRIPKKEDNPITIMLFVDCKPGTENIFKAVYHTAMPQFRSEAGVINYQLSQLEDDSTQFVTYEKFRNEEAFQYHLKFPPIQPVIDYLNTSIKQQPFQTGLHRLIEFAPMAKE